MTYPMQKSPADPLLPALDRNLLDALPDPVLAFDALAVLQMANQAALSLLKLTPQAVGQALSAILPADLHSAVLQAIAGESAEWHTEDEKTIYALYLKTISTGAKSTAVVQMLILQDVTRIKLLHQNYEDFVSTVLHDLRTPLTSMRGFADMLSMVGSVNDMQQQYIGKVLSGISQIASLIENSLDAGRLDPMTGSYKLLREVCRLDLIAEEVVATQKNEAERKHLIVMTEAGPDLAPVFLDEVMVRRALNNLVDNAIKYTPDGGQITVRAFIKGDSAYLSVQDSGAGISLEEQQTVFDRFTRLRHPEHVRVKGSGLGLFVVKNVAQWHGGDAFVESVPGKGSTFIMQFPIVNPPTAKSQPALAANNG